MIIWDTHKLQIIWDIHKLQTEVVIIWDTHKLAIGVKYGTSRESG